MDECAASLCRNAESCENTAGNYTCHCIKGFSGLNCETNLNDCRGQCLNGATCIDLIDQYHCACQPGFSGNSIRQHQFQFTIISYYIQSIFTFFKMKILCHFPIFISFRNNLIFSQFCVIFVSFSFWLVLYWKMTWLNYWRLILKDELIVFVLHSRWCTVWSKLAFTETEIDDLSIALWCRCEKETIDKLVGYE